MPEPISVTPVQDLLCELLAARYRLGEHMWTLGANGTVRNALIALEGKGLVGWKHGVVERTYLAWLTEIGRSMYLDASYSPPGARD